MNPTTDTGATEFLANLSIGTIVAVALILTVLRLVLMRPTAPAQFGRPAQIPPFARNIAEILESLIVAGVLVFLIIRPFFVQAFFIPSESMEPTLLGHTAGVNNHTDTVNDHIFVNKLVYRYSEPQRGDIIVFRAPKVADVESGNRGEEPKENVLIKRLIAVPGDTLEVKEEQVVRDGAPDTEAVVYRNGERLKEPYIKEPMETQNVKAIYGVGKPLKLKPGQYFVMGDNRNDSNDSRYWGTLERERIIGKASFIFWPFDRLGLIH